MTRTAFRVFTLAQARREEGRGKCSGLRSCRICRGPGRVGKTVIPLNCIYYYLLLKLRRVGGARSECPRRPRVPRAGAREGRQRVRLASQKVLQVKKTGIATFVLLWKNCENR